MSPKMPSHNKRPKKKTSESNDPPESTKKKEPKDPHAPKISKTPLTPSEAATKRQDLLSNLNPADKKRVSVYLPAAPATEHSNDNENENDTREKLNPAQTRALQRRGTSKHFQTTTQRHLENVKTRNVENAIAAANAELILDTQTTGLLEPEHEMEKTRELSQKMLKQEYLDEQTARQVFKLDLPHYGPYKMSFSRSGRHGILFGRMGHVSLMDCHQLSLTSEMHLNETVHDGTFLNNEGLYALAQKRSVCIYDDKGAEVHNVEEHRDPLALAFLPYHWLLCSVGKKGVLRYHDTSTGDLVSSHRTALGSCRVLRRNPRSSVVHLGHQNGFVTLWSPAQNDFLAKMMCHPGNSVLDLAIDHNGTTMVTAGANSCIKIWDLRMYRETHSYYVYKGPAISLDISQSGILGLGHSNRCTFWPARALKVKEKEIYMNHVTRGGGGRRVEHVRFRPFEDVCSVGRTDGYESIVIPGSGEANLDSMEYHLDPYEDNTRRREAEVRSLLDKLPPDMIGLEEEKIGTVEGGDGARMAHLREKAALANMRKEDMEKKKKETKKMRGRGKITKKIQKKQRMAKEGGLQLLKEKKKQERDQMKEDKTNENKQSAQPALKRFF